MKKSVRISVIIAASMFICCAFSSLSAADDIPVIEPVMIPETVILKAPVLASKARIADVHEGTIRISREAAGTTSDRYDRDEAEEYGNVTEESYEDSYDSDIYEPEEEDDSVGENDAYSDPDEEDVSDAEDEEEMDEANPAGGSDPEDIYTHFTEEEIIFIEEEPMYLDYTEELFHFGEEDPLVDESDIYDESEVDENVGEYEFYMNPDEIERMEESGMRAD